MVEIERERRQGLKERERKTLSKMVTLSKWETLRERKRARENKPGQMIDFY